MYLLDGRQASWNACIEVIVEALEMGEPVYHAYHHGADCYWIELEPPWFAQPVELTDDGLVVNGRLREPLLAS